MPKNNRKKVLWLKRAIQKGTLLVLGLASLYCFFKGKLVLSGFFFLIIGILNPFFGLPYTILFILISLALILLAYEKIICLIIAGLVISVIALADAVPLIRLMKSGKHREMRSGEFSVWLKENEVTYKLWNRLKRKYR